MNYQDVFWHTFNNDRKPSNEDREEAWIKNRVIPLPEKPVIIVVEGELNAH